MRLDDVARLAGVSRITVSRVLRQPEKVTPKTREIVHRAIESLSYVPNLVAGSLASRRGRIVAALVPTITNSLFAETLQALSATLRRAGYEILLGETSYALENEEALISVLLGHRPVAILLTQVVHSEAARARLKGAGIPIVETWDLTDEPLDLLVGFSNARAARAMTRHLIDGGHRRIRYVRRATINPGDRTAPRHQGFLDEMRAAGLDPGEPLAVDDPLSILGSGRTVVDLLEREPGIEALFCTNELIAVGAILECQRRGIRVPDDVAVAGFGDVEIASAIPPGLTTVRIPGRAMGERAGAMLLDSIAGARPAETAVDLGFEIVVRGSTQPGRSPTPAR